MSLLLSLPEALTCGVLSEWIGMTDLVRFDTACCQHAKGLRHELLNFFTHDNMLTPRFASNDDTYIPWCCMRKLKFSKLYLGRRSVEKYGNLLKHADVSKLTQLYISNISVDSSDHIIVTLMQQCGSLRSLNFHACSGDGLMSDAISFSFSNLIEVDITNNYDSINNCLLDMVAQSCLKLQILALNDCRNHEGVIDEDRVIRIVSNNGKSLVSIDIDEELTASILDVIKTTCISIVAVKLCLKKVDLAAVSELILQSNTLSKLLLDTADDDDDQESTDFTDLPFEYLRCNDDGRKMVHISDTYSTQWVKSEDLCRFFNTCGGWEEIMLSFLHIDETVLSSIFNSCVDSLSVITCERCLLLASASEVNLFLNRLSDLHDISFFLVDLIHPDESIVDVFVGEQTCNVAELILLDALDELSVDDICRVIDACPSLKKLVICASQTAVEEIKQHVVSKGRVIDVLGQRDYKQNGGVNYDDDCSSADNASSSDYSNYFLNGVGMDDDIDDGNDFEGSDSDDEYIAENDSDGGSGADDGDDDTFSEDLNAMDPNLFEVVDDAVNDDGDSDGDSGSENDRSDQ